MIRLSLGCLLLALPVLAAPVPKDAGKVQFYFPVTVGAKWVYEDGTGEEEAVEVSAVEKSGPELVVSRKPSGGLGRSYAKVIVSAEGLRQEGVVLDGQTLSLWVLKTRLKSGDSWEVKGGGRRTVFGPEEVKVPAGKFQALRVVWEREGGTLTSWYAPGIGELKRVEKKNGTETVTRSLKSFSPGEKK